MSYSFCLRVDGPAERVSDAVCAAWMAAMCPMPPVPLGWLQVPSALLPAGFAAGWFDATAFVAHLAAQAADTRPLITRRMKYDDPDNWHRLYEQHRSDECPVCYQPSLHWTTPMEGVGDTRCSHWLCMSCWDKVALRDRRCPICRFDLDAWFMESHSMIERVLSLECAAFRVGDHVTVSPDFGWPSEVIGVSGVVSHVGDEVITVEFDTPFLTSGPGGYIAQRMTSSPYGYVLDRRADPVVTE
jgi:hypothetical protein